MTRVLVIDDEKPTLTMFRLFLNAQGYEVLVAEDGRSGLALLEDRAPTIVFTDLKMPEMDGFEVLRRIKKRHPDTEVIVITGHGDMDMVVQALNLEATDFINKPIGRRALESALQRAEARLSMPDRGACRLTLRRQGGRNLVGINGTLSGECRDELGRLCRSAKGGAAHGVVLEFDPNAAVNGSGIATLVPLLSELRREGCPATITGLAENYRTIFEMVGITRLAEVRDPAETTGEDRPSPG